MDSASDTPNSPVVPTAVSLDEVALSEILDLQSLGLNQDQTTQTLSDEVLIAQFRKIKCHQNSLFEYKSSFSEQPNSIVTIEDVNEVMDKGWQYLTDDYFSLNVPINWESIKIDSRSWQRSLHSWEPIDDLLRFLSSQNMNSSQLLSDPFNEKIFRFALTFILDWISNYSDFSIQYEGAAKFAWYDMNVGIHLHMLAYLVNVSSCDNSISNLDLMSLINTANNHLMFLIPDENYTANNNHGFYQAKGMLYFCHDVPELESCKLAAPLAEKRVLNYLATTFTEEGIHKEHSPQYHAYLLAEIEKLITDNYFSPEQGVYLRELDQKAQVNMAWMITPDSSFVGFGDTDRKEGEGQLSRTNFLFGLIRKDYPNRLPILDYYWTCTVDPSIMPNGTEPTIGDYSQSGYAFVRVPNSSNPQCSYDTYLAFAAAFHSRVHKHADDLTFDWYENGIPILLDSGRYGYEGGSPIDKSLVDLGFWYSDPKRIYVESTHAHNTVEIDGITDSRKDVSFYGSGIQKIFKSDQNLYVLTGKLTRKTGFDHFRTLILNPGKWVLVLDDIQAPQNDKAESHSYTQWFHLNPDANIELVDNQVTGTIKELPIQIVSLSSQNTVIETIKGQTEPRMQGWISFKYFELIENWAVGLNISARDAHFVTLLTVSDGKVIALPIEIKADGTQVISWQNEDTGVIEIVEIEDLGTRVNYSTHSSSKP
ncbi:MAG TPA: hypothetical protein DIW44_07985 [Anaerolineaceae bacterium]|nr:hypothetical protein [Anaerolineaceae bacterium]